MAINNKMPLDWHRINLKGWDNSISRAEKQIEDLQLVIFHNKERRALLEKQIKEAEKTGRTEFDEGRFLIPLAKKPAKPQP